MLERHDPGGDARSFKQASAQELSRADGGPALDLLIDNIRVKIRVIQMEHSGKALFLVIRKKGQISKQGVHRQ